MEDSIQAVRVEMKERYKAEIEQAKERARLELEQEHLQNLQLLEEELEKKHGKQMEGLATLQDIHEEDIQRINQEQSEAMER